MIFNKEVECLIISGTPKERELAQDLKKARKGMELLAKLAGNISYVLNTEFEDIEDIEE